MRILENQLPAHREDTTFFGTKIGQTWEAFGWQVAQKFGVDLAQPGAGILLELPGTSLSLLIQNLGDGYYAIAYGERAEDGLVPEVEIVFDASSEAGWALVRVSYSPKIRQEFMYSRGVSSAYDTNNEQYLDFEEFAGYVLEKIEKEGWIDYAIDVEVKERAVV